jgi:hypothetical protein
MMYFCLLLSSFVALYSGQTFCVYMGCTDIDYCIYDICGLWMVLVFFYGYVHGCVYGCVWVCVWGYVYGYRVSILREAWFNKYRGLPLLGARFHHHWDLLASRGPFLSSLGLTPSRGPFHHHWVLLLREARLNDSPNFSNFS